MSCYRNKTTSKHIISTVDHGTILFSLDLEVCTQVILQWVKGKRMEFHKKQDESPNVIP